MILPELLPSSCPITCDLKVAIARVSRRAATAAVALAFGGIGCSTTNTEPNQVVTEQRQSSDPLGDLTTVAPDIVISIRYATDDNFVGAAIDGYLANRCLLTNSAANALSAVQQEARSFGLSLVVYDCYRPQRAVDHFMRWARSPDLKNKAKYYPAVAKDQLIPQGYIAEQSGHSRGSTLDVGLVFNDGTEVAMGTDWDFFDPRSHTANETIEPSHRANRLLLRSLMQRHGFTNYPKEWWHYTLVNEPYPNTYFDKAIVE